MNDDLAFGSFARVRGAGRSQSRREQVAQGGAPKTTRRPSPAHCSESAGWRSVRYGPDPRGFGGSPLLYAGESGAVRDEVFRFGALLSDGGKATNLDETWGERDWEVKPDGPVLCMGVAAGQTTPGARATGCEPLPPLGDLTFVCEWPAMAIPESRTSIDTTPIRAAAGQAITLWPAPGGDASDAKLRRGRLLSRTGYATCRRGRDNTTTVSISGASVSPITTEPVDPGRVRVDHRRQPFPTPRYRASHTPLPDRRACGAADASAWTPSTLLHESRITHAAPAPQEAHCFDDHRRLPDTRPVPRRS